jgi:hypothetical protein
MDQKGALVEGRLLAIKNFVCYCKNPVLADNTRSHTFPL